MIKRDSDLAQGTETEPALFFHQRLTKHLVAGEQAEGWPVAPRPEAEARVQ